jgi:hypothetical protein
MTVSHSERLAWAQQRVTDCEIALTHGFLRATPPVEGPLASLYRALNDAQGWLDEVEAEPVSQPDVVS